MKASERELSSTTGFRDTEGDFSVEEELALEALEVEVEAVVDVESLVDDAAGSKVVVSSISPLSLVAAVALFLPSPTTATTRSTASSSDCPAMPLIGSTGPTVHNPATSHLVPASSSFVPTATPAVQPVRAPPL